MQVDCKDFKFYNYYSYVCKTKINLYYNVLF